MDIHALIKMAPDLLTHVIESGRPLIVKYGFLAIAVGLFSETFFFAGFFVPGYAILMAAGFLVAAKVLGLIQVVALAWASAVFGDICSYCMGLYWGSRLLRRHSDLVKQIRYSLEKESIILVLSYHYVHMLRAVLPCTAGSIRFSIRQWLPYDALGVLIWVVLVFSIGYCAHETIFAHGNALALLVNALATLLMIVVSWRVCRNYSTIAKARSTE